MNHKILLAKLTKINVSQNAITWFDNYLSNRAQSTYINGCRSNTRKVCGVSQGSILGPLLFLIYVNDMAAIPNYSKCLLYADNSVIFKSIQTTEDLDQLQEHLIRINQWCQQNKLTINIAKTKVVHYPRNRNSVFDDNFTLDGISIQKVLSYKYLGIDLDAT